MATGETGRWRRAVGLLVLAVGLALGIGGALILPQWLMAAFPRRVVRQLAADFLNGLLVAYLAGLAVAVPGLVVLAGSLRRARRRGIRAPRRARALAACGSFLVGAAILEGLAAARLARVRRVELPAPRFAAEAGPGSGEIYLVVIGESTAMGLPYHPWLSIGQVVAWQLERAIPGRRVVVETRAGGGFNLVEGLQGLEGLKRRPDAILLYSGHNEFQGFYRLSREVAYYADQFSARDRWARRVRRASPLAELILATLEKQLIDSPPPPSDIRRLVDGPACTPEERAEILASFRARLGGFAAYCERAGTLPIVFVPAGNDAGFDPSRSVLDPSATAADRSAFGRDFGRARSLERSDPKASEAAYRALLAGQPGFAEAHFRLARLLERSGDHAGANRHYVEARDRDALPLRCPSDFQAAVRDAMAGHDALVIDAPEVLRPLAEHGILDGRLFSDAHHPNLIGYSAMAGEVLRRLQARGAFGWPADRAAPTVDPAEVADHFGLDRARWSEVCRRSEDWYGSVAPIRFDPADRLARKAAYAEATRQIRAGTPPDRAGVPGLGAPAVKTTYK